MNEGNEIKRQEMKTYSKGRQKKSFGMRARSKLISVNI